MTTAAAKRAKTQRLNLTEERVRGADCPIGKDRVYIHDAKVQGFTLCVTGAGSKTFYLYRRIGGRPERVRLGDWPALPVDDARKAAQAKIGEIAKGDNPAEAKRQERQRKSLGELLDAYMEEQRQRAKLTTQHRESVDRRRRLSAGGLADIDAGVKTFRAWLDEQGYGGARIGGTSFETMLIGYRAWLDKRLEAGDYTPHTVNNKVKILRPLVDWLWRHRHLRDMPRTLDSATSKYKPEPQAKPLSLDDVRRLWLAADERLRCLIALGLNCGLYAAELATLKREHVIDRYLAKRREKSGVPYKIKLWPITLKLMEKQRVDEQAGDLLFRTERGQPLVHQEIGKHKTDSLTQALKRLREEHPEIDARWSQLRDTSADHVERMADGDDSLVSHFLAHADQRTARFYIDTEPAKLDRPKLDAITDKLLDVYDRLDADRMARALAKSAKQQKKGGR